MNIGSDFGWISAVLAALFLFGVAFNAFVGWAHRQGFSDGYTAIQVVVGVMFTLAGYALMPGTEKNIPLLLAAFAASGAPMIAGDIWRHVKARQRARERLAGL